MSLVLLGLVLFLFPGVFGVTTNYTVAQANRFCEFCLAAYCCGNLGHGTEDWTCEACKKQPQMTDITVFHSSIATYDANGYVGYDTIQKAIVVAFAGTDPLSITDWIDDIDFIKVPYPACESEGCEVHKGFYDTYLSVQDEIWNAVQKLWTKYGRKTNFQVTGHSLGGALAVHCAIDFYDSGDVEPQYVYTFGEPRVGNTQFATYYTARIYNQMRVTHHKDPVPHLPTEDMGFYHEPREYFYPNDPNTTYTICTDSGEDPDCSDRYLIDLDIADHLDYMGFDFTSNFISCKI